MTAPAVLAAAAWPTNADLIADVARLGYLHPDDRILDPTHGRGIWWKKWRPAELVTSDLRADGTDFRDLPHPDDTFDAVAYDPPYVCTGGRSTTGLPDLYDRFGLTDAPTTPAAVQRLVNDGLTEAHRVVKPSGIVLVKCQDYVTSGRLFPGTHYTLTHALDLRFELVDRLEHLGGVRPQPSGRTRACPTCKTDPAACTDDRCADGRVPTVQQHARRNLSTLLVLRKARR